MMPLAQLLQILEAATKLLVILGGGFTAWQYLEAKQTARVERTFEYVKALSHGDEAKARQTIIVEQMGYQPSLQELWAQALSPADAAAVHAKLIGFLVKDSRGGQGLALEIDRIVDLFNEVAVCVERHLCEAEVAQAFLGETGRVFWINFEPYFRDQRALIPTYAAGLERFVKSLPPPGDPPR